VLDDVLYIQATQDRRVSEQMDAIVVGQIARDLVLVVDEVPDAGTALPVHQRREMLDGKGANQAVGLAQLNVLVALLGVVGQLAGETTSVGDLRCRVRGAERDLSGLPKRSGAQGFLEVAGARLAPGDL
jgi:ribokinase